MLLAGTIYETIEPSNQLTFWLHEIFSVCKCVRSWRVREVVWDSNYDRQRLKLFTYTGPAGPSLRTRLGSPLHRSRVQGAEKPSDREKNTVLFKKRLRATALV